MHIFHFFIPHHKNNHRAKLLHNVTILILIISVALVSSLSLFVHKTSPEVLGIYYQITDQELLNLTNYEREQNGLRPLSLNSKLTSAAQKKATHMLKNNYWAHFAPDGTTPWDFIKGEKYDYVYAGENLAKGYTTSHSTVKAWMNSPTHKANILSKQYSEVGFAILEGRLDGEDTILIVQELGATDNLVVKDQKSIEGDRGNIAFNTVPGVQGSHQMSLLDEEAVSFNNLTKDPLVDIGVAAKILTFLLLSVLLVALVLDFVIIEKKKIPRSVGNNLDHIMLVTIFLAFILMAKIGHVI